MKKGLTLLAFLAAQSALFAWTPASQTLVPVADTKVSQFTPDTNFGSDTTLRVRQANGQAHRSFLRFQLPTTSVVQSARLRLFCTDSSPRGGTVFALYDSGWSESAVTWMTQPQLSNFVLGSFPAVTANTWVELDVTRSVAAGTRVFEIATGSDNSAYYSSREGVHPPELVVTVAGGSSNPVVEFSANPVSGQEPLQTVFTDLSTGQVTGWSWSFGDGSSSTQKNPVHTYSNAGTYSVSLTASGPGGSTTLTKSGLVHVLDTTSVGIWTGSLELSQLPMSGSAWNSLLAEANRATGTPAIVNQDDGTDVRVMAKALVFARTGNQSYRTQVIDACMRAIGTEAGGRTLALGRNLIGYVLAADLVKLPAAQDATFRAWLRTCLTETLDGMTLRSTHEDRPNNWGTHAGASRAAVALYLGDQAELARCAQVFKGWLGDRSSYSGFQYGDLSWQADSSHPVGINPRGATRQGHSIDGVLPDDQRRAGGFLWPPPKENYVWEALQGALAQAVILSRAGYAVWDWQDQALLRAVRWLHQECNFPAGGDDTWEPHVVNYFYVTDFPAPTPSSPGKNVGWTDWTLPAR